MPNFPCIQVPAPGSVGDVVVGDSVTDVGTDVGAAVGEVGAEVGAVVGAVGADVGVLVGAVGADVGGMVWNVGADVIACTIEYRSLLGDPAPIPERTPVVALVSTAVLTSEGVACGLDCRCSAATPAVYGDPMDVPASRT